MSIRDKLKEIIRELIRKELAEVSVTGNIDGGEGPPKTPYAFGKNRKKIKRKKMKYPQILQDIQRLMKESITITEMMNQ